MRPLRSLTFASLLSSACGGSSADAIPDAEPSAIDATVVDAAPPDAREVTLTSPGQFAPGLGGLCGLGFDVADEQVWLYPCNGADVHIADTAGAAVTAVTRPGESADDVDVDTATAAFTLGETAVAEGDMLFFNGEAGPVDVYVLGGAAAPALTMVFGDSHVVGGSFHPGRGTLFVVQDRQSALEPNIIAEVDPLTGATVASFSVADVFSVNFGDLTVCPASGSLFLVSSDETTLAELTPTGALVAEYPLPPEVSGPSGVGLTGAGGAWVTGTGGQVYEMAGVPCP